MLDNGTQPGTDSNLSRRQELGEFLKTRRANLRPQDLDLSWSGRRRTPGLRREEVASLAGVGVVWYTWLEQGRDIRVSPDLLGRLSKALRLQAHEVTYLFSLAGHHPPEQKEANVPVADDIQAVVDGYIAGPAFAFDALFEVIVFNDLADFVYHFQDYSGSRPRNIMWRNFMDPYRRQLYVPWLECVELGVGHLRVAYATRVGNPEFESLIRDLSKASPDFDRLWKASAQRGPSSYHPFPIKLHVPDFGTLSFVSVRFALPARPDWRAVFLSPADDHTRTAMVSIRNIEPSRRNS